MYGSKKDFFTSFPASHSATYPETQGIIMQFVARFLSSVEFVSRNAEPIPLKILDAIHYIQSSLKSDLTVSSLAKRANLHQDYFSSLFRQSTGERPLAYVQVKRIERAQYLLATTQLSHEEIAEETGFENPPYFFRIFKKVTLLTPGEYKKRNGLTGSPK
ncbi:MAG TPA: helix-turn-helix domain-containing protein [Puia sp.]|nr:helix-turn-helix domain-containing protein [Puia sp.]